MCNETSSGAIDAAGRERTSISKKGNRFFWPDLILQSAELTELAYTFRISQTLMGICIRPPGFCTLGAKINDFSVIMKRQALGNLLGIVVLW